jgi:hypothetical protein
MKCETPRCRNVSTARLCKKCYQRDYRKRNALKYCFSTLMNNAKRRGKEFDLTLEQFEKFAIETNYLHGKGRMSESFHIDRIDPLKGYTIENIRVLTNSENVKRHLSFIRYGFDERGVPENFHVVVKNLNQTEEGLPF